MWEVLINFIFDKYPLITCFLFGVFFTWLIANFYFKRFCPLEAGLKDIQISFKDLKDTIKTAIKESLLFDKEVSRKSNVQKMHIPNSDKPVY